MARSPRKKKVAYQGVAGSFSEAAAHSWAEASGLAGASLLPARNARGVIRAVRSGDADYGVVGVFNSTSGVIGETADAMEEFDHEPVASISIPVQVGLFGFPGGTLADVRTIYSHPSSLFQCEKKMRALLPHAELIASPTSGVAAQRMADRELPDGSAVLCSQRAGRLGRLALLAFPANDSPLNETAFMVFRKK